MKACPTLKLCNDTKIQFCNAMDKMRWHCKGCDQCDTYIVQGDGDICEKGKDIILANLAYAETNPLRGNWTS